MKTLKKVVALLVLTISLIVPADATHASESNFIVDNANTLSSEQLLELNELSSEMASSSKIHIYIMTVYDVESYGHKYADVMIEDVYDSDNLGYEGTRDGVLLLVSVLTRDYSILQEGSQISESALDVIENNVVGYLSRDDWYGAFKSFIEDSYNAADADRAGMGSTSYGNETVVVNLSRSFIIPVIVCVFFVSHHFDKDSSKAMCSYVDSSLLDVKKKNEKLIRTTKHVIRNKSSSGSGSRGRRSSGRRSVRSGKF